MNRPSGTLLLLVVMALAVGLAEPPLEVAWKCRHGFETSEACVWGKSLLPLGRAIGLLLITPVTLGLLLFARWAWQARTGRPGSPD